MKYERAAGLALAAVVAVPAACAYSEQDASVQEVLIDPSVLPGELPGPVAERVNHAVAVAIKEISPPDSALGPKTISYGSGVALDQSVGITAGHVLYDSEPVQFGPVKLPFIKKAVPVAESCGQVAVSGNSDQPKRYYDLTLNPVDLYGATATATHYTGSYDVDFDTPDVAMYRLAGQLPLTLGQLSIRDTPVEAGEPLFFMNYQPDEEGRRRMPDQTYMLANGDRQGYAAPAVYGGVMLAEEENGQIAVADGFINYGKVVEGVVRPGASGGPVFDAQGKLVGVVSRTNLAHEPLGSIADRYDLAVAKEDEVLSAHVSYVEPLTPDVMHDLVADLEAAPSCLLE